MLASFSEQTVADVRENIQKHMDAYEREYADGENDQGEFGKMRDGMERFVRDCGNELVRGARMTFRRSLS
jgi:hypothetical protein